MFACILALFATAAVAPALVRRVGTKAFALLAVAPAIAFGWALTHVGTIRAGGRVTERIDWIPHLGLHLDFSLGALQWLLVLIVVGIGALVLVYCASYFDDAPEVPGFAGVFVAFVAAMLGLVVADNLLLLYIFWELTTVFSYLLIGTQAAKATSRTAAMQAIIVTTLGGLAMLVGMLMVGVSAGTYRISELIAHPPLPSAGLTVAVAFMLLGALTKSAQVPFHFWLPGAMAAPTPVSAYLHAASMVKAGVYLVALLAPAFAATPGWRPALLVLGLATMLVGGWRALRQYDIKLLLAYGTVSQLGFLMLILGIGTRAAAVAGLALLLAHALFKAALFLVVGIIDHATGTRDLRRLSGLCRTAPAVGVAALLGALSMAGVIPLLGFVAKEAAFQALIDIAHTGDGTALAGGLGWAVLAGVVAGSVLTAAYTIRFVWGAFADKRGVGDTPLLHAPGPAFVAAPLVLAGTGLILAFAGGLLTEVFDPYAAQFPLGAHEPALVLWHGWSLPLALSAVALFGGALVFWRRVAVARVQSLLKVTSAEQIYRHVMRGLDRVAVEVTSLTQRGSLAAYLAITMIVVLAVPGSALVRAVAGHGQPRLWDSPAQALVGAIVILAALMATRSRRRMRAVILVGAVGYGCALLFVLHGAPDLALTQILVETVSIVVFVLVLRRLPEYFTDRPLSRRRYWRILLGTLVGLAVAGFMLVTTGARHEVPVSAAWPGVAVSYGGGGNIVNVALVDIRAWDTIGEIAVLVAAATGVASLIFIQTRLSDFRRVADIPYPAEVTKQPSVPGRRVWLPGPRTLAADRRSIIFEVVTRLVFHTIIVYAIYLLFAGHNHPGGGFAAGMVTGLALVVRYLVGGKYELTEAAPVDAGILMGTGLFIGAVSGLAPVAFGGAVFQSIIVDLRLGPLGDVHLVSSVGFDIGVYLVVVALILDLLRTFGARLDRQIERQRREAEASGDTADARELDEATP